MRHVPKRRKRSFCAVLGVTCITATGRTFTQVEGSRKNERQVFGSSVLKVCEQMNKEH